MIPGICCSDKSAAAVARHGFRYIEPAMTSLRRLSDADLKEIRCRTEDAGVYLAGTNCFFGGDVTLYNDGGSMAVEYAKRNLEVAAIIGASYCVIGSGRARSVPFGSDRDKIMYSFIRLIDEIGGFAASFGVKIALEPLQMAETNLINTLSECVDICRATGNSNVGCLVDFYHFYRNGEDLSEFDLLKPGELVHVHIAGPDSDRSFPRKSDAGTLEGWFGRLRQIGYDGKVSLECSWGEDFEEGLAESIAVIGPYLNGVSYGNCK